MKNLLTRLVPAALLALSLAAPAFAADPTPGGVVRLYQRDNPASASLHEEATYSTIIPFMGIFNNLVRYKQDAPQNSDATIETPSSLASGASCSVEGPGIDSARSKSCVSSR